MKGNKMKMETTTDLAVARLFTLGLKDGYLTKDFVDSVVEQLLELSEFWETEGEDTGNKILKKRADLADNIATKIQKGIK